MNYGFGKDQVIQHQIPFPISSKVENTTLVKVEYVSGMDRNKQEYEAIDFLFKRSISEKRTQTLNSRIFAVDEDKVTPKPNQTLEEAILKEYQSFNTKLLHIAEAFNLSIDDLNNACSESKTFQELANNYSTMVNNKSNEVLCWLKTVPNKKGYAQLPPFGNIIQPMSDGECTLKYSDYELKLIKRDQAPPSGVHEEKDVTYVENEDDY